MIGPRVVAQAAARVVVVRVVARHVPHLAGLPKGVVPQAALAAVRQRVAVAVQEVALVVAVVVAALHRVNPSHRNLEITVKSPVRHGISLSRE
jgi:hypothetical protein